MNMIVLETVKHTCPVLRMGPHMVPENSQDVFVVGSVVGSVVGGWWKEWY